MGGGGGGEMFPCVDEPDGGWGRGGAEGEEVEESGDRGVFRDREGDGCGLLVLKLVWVFSGDGGLWGRDVLSPERSLTKIC